MTSSAENGPSSNDWRCTQTRGDRIEFEWTIKKFHQLPQENEKCIVSPVFPSNKKSEQWKIKMYPKGEEKGEEEEISIFLCRISDGMKGIKVKCEFIIFQLNKIVGKFEFMNTYEKFPACGCLQLVKRSKLSVQNDPTDTITIHCKIDILGTYITSSFDKKSWDKGIRFGARKNRLTEDLQLFFNEDILNDFTVLCGDEKFQTHKAILASRSSVFAAMFQHKDVDENVKNEVKIENIEPAVVRGLLEFIYTDDVSEIGELAHGLLAAAEQYQLEGLKNLCEETIYKTLNKDNAAELLTLADLHNATQLKKFIMQFIVDHHKTVVESAAFESAKLSEELLREIIRALIPAENEDNPDSE